MEETIPLRKLDGCINTFTGKKLNLIRPSVEMIDIQDIARGLAYKSHFGGQTPFYFSIADHSILVYLLMLQDGERDFSKLLLGLLHDASEAYLGNMLKPIKIHLSYFCSVEDNMMSIICKAYGLEIGYLPSIKPYDLAAQDLEYETFYKKNKLVRGQTPNQSLKMFLKIYNNLINNYIDVNEGTKIFNATSQRKS